MSLLDSSHSGYLHTGRVPILRDLSSNSAAWRMIDDESGGFILSAGATRTITSTRSGALRQRHSSRRFTKSGASPYPVAPRSPCSSMLII
jgi:hypothetical protein